MRANCKQAGLKIHKTRLIRLGLLEHFPQRRKARECKAVRLDDVGDEQHEDGWERCDPDTCRFEGLDESVGVVECDGGVGIGDEE